MIPLYIYQLDKSQNTEYVKCWPGCGAPRNLIHSQCRHKPVQPLDKTVWQHLLKLNTCLPIEIPLLGIDLPPKQMGSIHQNTHVKIFIATLFIIKQTGCF